MASCLLFHGPNAREMAIQKALQVGHLMAPPFGDEGLSTDDAREFVLTLLNTPLHSSIGVAIAGPLDEAKSKKACDVLLKSIEEFNGNFVLPILWAKDFGGVPLTIRSRCLDTWCPGEVAITEGDDELMRIAWEVISKVQEGDISGIPAAAKPIKDNQCVRFLGILAEVLAAQIDNPVNLKLWLSLRQIAVWDNPKPAEIVTALMVAGNP